MKRRVRITLMILIIIILSVVIIKIYDSKDNSVIKSAKISNNKSSMLSMMFETENTGIYEKRDDIVTWPDNYYFNSELSGCEHGGSVSFKNNKVVMESSYTDKCYVYFSNSSSGSSDDSEDSEGNAPLLISRTVGKFSYDASSQVQSITIGKTGYYKLEAWGAQGGGTSGGYTTGIIKLEKDTELYIVVGSRGFVHGASYPGSAPAGGYNGGGNGGGYGSGGGATHIALASGTLPNLASQKDKIILVAGGGAGNIGSGAGTPTPGNDPNANNVFGQGATGSGYAGGGGGGYTGGTAGRGGSGYAGYPDLFRSYIVCNSCTATSNVQSIACANEAATSNCSKWGDGYAKITYLGSNMPTIEISTIEDLVRFANTVNNDSNFFAANVKLNSDLDFNSTSSYENANRTDFGDLNGNGTIEGLKTELTTGAGFVPIGKGETTPFKGIFDGQEHKIYNLYENKANADAGLFRYVNGATIKNLGIESGSIYSANGRASGLVVHTYGNTIVENCYNNTSVSNGSTVLSSGLVGVSYGNITIKNSHNTGNVRYGNNTGGILAATSAEAVANSQILIENCYNTGEISKTNMIGGTGGILGANLSTTATVTIKNTYNEGTISETPTATKMTYTGGIVGRNVGKLIVENTKNTGEVSNKATFSNTTATNYAGLGGILGYNEGTFIANKTYNTGKITSANQITNFVGHGGIIGWTDDNTSSGKEAIIINSYNTREIDGGVMSGGIVGAIGQTQAKLYIINSYNTGNVIYLNNAASGITSSFRTSNSKATTYINNVYNNGDILAQTATGIFKINPSATYSLNNSYYKTANTTLNTNSIDGSTVAGVCTTTDNTKCYGMSLANMKTDSFVTRLNNTVTSLNNAGLKSINANLDGYTLVSWKMGPDGYPVLDY